MKKHLKKQNIKRLTRCRSINNVALEVSLPFLLPHNPLCFEKCKNLVTTAPKLFCNYITFLATKQIPSVWISHSVQNTISKTIISGRLYNVRYNNFKLFLHRRTTFVHTCARAPFRPVCHIDLSSSESAIKNVRQIGLIATKHVSSYWNGATILKKKEKKPPYEHTTNESKYKNRLKTKMGNRDKAKWIDEIGFGELFLCMQCHLIGNRQVTC